MTPQSDNRSAARASQAGGPPNRPYPERSRMYERLCDWLINHVRDHGMIVADGCQRLESLSQPGRPPLSLASHRRIAAAIRWSDPAAAPAAAKAHVELVGDVELLRSRDGHD